MTDEDDFHLPFRIDISSLDFRGSFNCLGRLIGLVIREAHMRLGSELPAGIILRNTSHRVPDRHYEVVTATGGYFSDNKLNAHFEIFAVYDPIESSVMAKCGANLTGLIDEAKIWRSDSENYDNDD
uniref:Uncharacterized protein n=1 Tax=Bosea sp. NBC_00436 TaxID=2969620 RepID=A0A9E8CNA5_9HYPH